MSNFRIYKYGADLIYSKEFLKKKIDKISELYDLKDPIDLFTVLPQEMELVDVRGMIHKSTGQEKRDAVTSVIMGAANKNGIKLPKEWVEVFVDTIIKASKGGFAINKEKT